MTDQNRPTLKELHDVMRHDGVATRWYSLGLQLMDDSGVLDKIKSNYPNDVESCCNEMFKKWLEMTPNASWDQLATELIKINLRTVADHVIARHTSKIVKPKHGMYVRIYAMYG